MKEKKIYWTFVLSTGLAVALVLAGMLIDLAVRMRDFTNGENVAQARAYYKTLLSAWQWNARTGSVYAERNTGEGTGAIRGSAEFRSPDGRVFAVFDHALMTREIMNFAEKEHVFQFRFVSLKPLDPRNRPDAFEERALNQFTQGGLREAYGKSPAGGGTHFRYIAPLTVEKGCLRCHGSQNFTLGSILGGISVNFDLEGQRAGLRRMTATIIVFGLLAAALLLGLIFWFAHQLMKRLSEARTQIDKITITDELTGVFNRRHILNRFAEEYEQARRLKSNLSCIIADIDYFKTVNDVYGHLAGDEVLIAVGKAFKGLVRAYDLVGRSGGEEFLFVLPDTSIEQAWHFAERVRMHIRGQAMADRQITISLGVTGRDENDQSVDDMIKRADIALLHAKEAGRDRVAWSPDEE